MSVVAIRVEQVGKRYRIGRRAMRHDRFGEWALDRITAPFRAALGSRGPAGGRQEEPETTLWALKDVSFTVQHGSVTGIIGHNGAGKSTILKILSRITEPTTGHVDIFGRVSSLLEVGTGFHPELTGRENIYLNGGILGLRRGDIRARLERIVEFAEIARFVDTPVKHYSSGMYVRLAFSVAAHLEPDILLVDEILAVGDLAFQKKCLTRMDSISRDGRTVLVVSHNMNIIRRLCERCVLLDRGRVAALGATPEVVERYLASASPMSAAGTWIPLDGQAANGTARVRIQAVRFTGPHASTTGGQPVPFGRFEVSLDLLSDADRVVDSIAVSLLDRYGTKLVNADTLSLARPVPLRAGRNRVSLGIECLYLNPGTYALGVWVANPPHEVFASTPQAALVQVVETEDQRIRVNHDGLVPCRVEVLEACGWAGAEAGAG